MTPETPGCHLCRGTGRTGWDPALRLGNNQLGYCTCQLGRELERMDRRRAEEDLWGLAQQDVRFPNDTSSVARLRAMIESVQPPEE